MQEEMRRWSSEKERTLCEKLESAAAESGLDYERAMSVLNHVRIVFSGKGNNLLNAANIREVAKQERR